MTKTIKILGSGCSNCQKLEANAQDAIDAKGIDAVIEHVTDFVEIAQYGVVSTPGLVIDNQVVSTGKVLSAEEIEKLI